MYDIHTVEYSLEFLSKSSKYFLRSKMDFYLTSVSVIDVHKKHEFAGKSAIYS